MGRWGKMGRASLAKPGKLLNSLCHQLCKSLTLTLEHPAPSPPPSQEKHCGKGREPQAAQTAWHRKQLISGFPSIIPAPGKWVFLLNCLLQSRSAESSSSHLINQVSNSNSRVWSCHHSKKERNRSEELPAAPTHCGGAAAAGNKDLFSSQPQPWTGSLPKPSSNHSRDSGLREGSSSPRFGKDGLCCASLELAEAQVWLVPSYLLTVKPEKKGGKILQLAVNLFAQGLSCS